MKFDKKYRFFCEIGSTFFDNVKFEAEKIISLNSQEHLKGKATAFYMNHPLSHLLIYKIHFLTDLHENQKNVCFVKSGGPGHSEG